MTARGEEEPLGVVRGEGRGDGPIARSPHARRAKGGAAACRAQAASLKVRTFVLFLETSSGHGSPPRGPMRESERALREIRKRVRRPGCARMRCGRDARRVRGRGCGAGSGSRTRSSTPRARAARCRGPCGSVSPRRRCARRWRAWRASPSATATKRSRAGPGRSSSSTPATTKMQPPGRNSCLDQASQLSMSARTRGSPRGFLSAGATTSATKRATASSRMATWRFSFDEKCAKRPLLDMPTCSASLPMVTPFEPDLRRERERRAEHGADACLSPLRQRPCYEIERSFDLSTRRAIVPSRRYGNEDTFLTRLPRLG